MSWSHRPALDGLRTVAVYVVVLFHAGLDEVGGGFVGVDLFFVLSGFLVASILLVELDDTGRVRLGRFYARRVRRLLPAALVVVAATAFVFVLVASAVRRLPFAGDAQASLLYVANWRFLAQAGDYFATDVDRSPYLHFWSLSIEEQFYLAFPLLLLGLAALGRRRRGALVAGVVVLAAASLLAQVVWAQVDADHAYYGTDARAYQLLAGVLAALWWRRARATAPAGADGGGEDGGEPVPTPDRRGGGVVTVAALGAFVVVASGLVDPSPSNRGLLATVAAVGLVLGVVVAPASLVARALAGRVPAYLGTISYGTYLWHWPVVLVLLEVLDTSPWVVAVLTTVLATALASMSFHVLEHPVRSSRRLAARAPAVVAAGLAASVALALVVPVVLDSDRRPVLAADQVQRGGGPLVPTDVDWTAYADDRGPEQVVCTPEDTSTCVVHTGGSGLHVALVGDSHARMVAPMMGELAEEHDFTLSANILVNCPWQRDLISEDGVNPDCRATRADLYDTVLAEMEVDVVVLVQRGRDRGPFAESAAAVGADEGELDTFNATSMRDTLDDVRAAGARAVMVRPIIELPPDQDPLDCLSRARFVRQCAIPVPVVPAPSDSFQTTLGVTVEGAASITLNDLVCDEAPLCSPLRGETPVWRNYDHLTPAVLLDLSDRVWERLTATGLLEP